MTEFLIAVYALRWPLVVIAFIVLGALYADALSIVREAEKRARAVSRHNRVLRDEVARLQAERAAAQRSTRFEVASLERYRGRRG